MKYFLGILVFACLFIFVKPVSAVSIVISNAPSTISTENFNLSVNISGPNPGTNYLRVDIYKEGSKNYFGETFNGNSWYGGSDGQQYFPVMVSSEGSSSATLQGRIGTPNNSKYPGPGAYKLRIRRYVSSDTGNSDTQTPYDVQISAVFVSPTPTPDPTLSPTSSPESLSTPSLSPSSSTKVTASTFPQNKKVLPTPNPINSTPKSSQNIAEVLAATEGLAVAGSPLSSPGLEVMNEKYPLPLAGMLLIGGGILFSGAAGFLLYYKTSKSKLV